MAAKSTATKNPTMDEMNPSRQIQNAKAVLKAAKTEERKYKVKERIPILNGYKIIYERSEK